MLKFLFTDVDDEIIEVTNPLSMTVNIEQDVPCDDMVATFPYFSTKELKSVVVSDNDVVVFSGVIDEQQTISSKNGEYIKVVSRSMAANLTDNESVPVSYNHPCADVIARRHIRPFGVEVNTDYNTTYFGVQTIHKGASNWQAVEDFCKNVHQSSPRVDEHGTLNFEQKHDDKVYVFSNNGDGIPYISFEQNIRRCDEISTVRVKVTNSCGYNSVITNDDAINRGIVRERYINSVLTDTPAMCADKMIKKGRQKSYTVTVQCSGRHLSLCMKNAVIKDSVCGDIQNLYVSAIRYQLDNKKDVTTLTLKRKEV